MFTPYTYMHIKGGLLSVQFAVSARGWGYETRCFISLHMRMHHSRSDIDLAS